MSFISAVSASPTIVVVDSTKSLPSKSSFSRSSPATFRDSSGIIQSSSANTLRTEFSRDGVSLGYLLEDSKQNKSLNSKIFSFTNSPGSANGISWGVEIGQVNAVSQPDVFGTNSATLVTLHSSGGSWDFYSNYTGFVNGRAYTWSCFVKLGTATNFCIIPNDATAWDTLGVGRVWSLGELSTTKWTRVFLTFVANSTNSVNMHIGKHSNISQPIQQTDGTVYLCGHQMEEYDLSSFIDTNSSPVTRSSDELLINCSSGNYNIKKYDIDGIENSNELVSGPYRVIPKNTKLHLKRIEFRRGN